jgi:long-chain acyl-CoA synthetase
MRYRHLINDTVRLYGPADAVVCGAVTRTFDEVGERANRLGNALESGGLGAGDRVAVLLPNCPEYVEIDVGLAQAGLVRVSLNARATARQQIGVIEDSAATALIYSKDFASMAEEILAASDGLRVVLELGGDATGGDVEDYEKALAEAEPRPSPADPDPGDLYCLFYTSGTTGRPKGVMLSHAAYFAVARNLLLEFGPVAAGDRVILTQPLSHGGGFFLLPWLMSGATCVVMERYDAVACLELTERHGAQTLKVVPTMLLQMLSAGIEPPSLPALRKVIYGASPMPAKQLGDLLELFGPVFTQLYGQAEAPMSITVLDEAAHAAGGRLLASAGRPWRGVEVKVVDEEGQELGPGETGEVIVSGPHRMDGYWQQPELTAEVLRDGWIHTRDMAETDERGFVYLLGRSDEMIISGGFNVAPRVVEDALNRHPAILESAVLGLPHDTLGQEVAAFVSLRPGAAATVAEIVDFSRAELGYQKPRQVHIVERLPRNAYGKVANADLRALAGKA